MTTKDLIKVLRSAKLSNLMLSAALSTGVLTGCAGTVAHPVVAETTASLSVRVHWVSANEAAQ